MKEEIEELEKLSHYCALKNIDREDNTFGEFVVAIQKVRNYIDQLENKVKELETTKAMQEYRINEMDIPKQVIIGKIEELSNIKGDLATYIVTSERIKVLQELLEVK